MIIAALLFGVAGTTMRLHLNRGDLFEFSLKIERQNPPEKAEIQESVKIESVERGVVTMRIRLAGLNIDGQDRRADLRQIIGSQDVLMPWDRYSRRVGGMTGLRLGKGDPKVLAFLAEAGIYACYFSADPVKPGDRWNGATTATGGCTNGVFEFTKLDNSIAQFQITDIDMAASTQIGPMTMAVDLKHGLPTKVRYAVKDNRTGRRTDFEQTLTRVTRAVIRVRERPGSASIQRLGSPVR
jgi:hypothetical protein